MILQVETATAPNGDVEPRSFLLGGQRITVIEINDRWLARDYSYFKVQASDGATYILRYDETPPEWHLTLFRAPGQ